MADRDDDMRVSLTRRGFLARTAAAGAALALPGLARAEGAPARRPNFVFVLTDDQRWDLMSGMGNTLIRTPHMDRLAAEGARFDNAFVTISLCSPSRGCFLTGQYAHTHGVIDNRGSHIAPDALTFPLLLQRAGYATAYAGKWHMGNRDEPRPGFDRWVSFRGQGVYNNPTFNVDGAEVKREGYVTDLITDYAVDWLKQRRDGRPFCLYVGHKAVHGPFTPAERHKNALDGKPIPRPKTFNDDFAGKPEWVKQRGGKQREAESYERFVRDYSATILAVDDGVGRLLDALRETGALDDTVFVFASDNGFFLGEHGFYDKRAMYEEALRIPLLMRYPRLVKPGTRVPEMALNIDVAPTFLDLAGVPIPQAIQGRSLRPVLEGRAGAWRDSFLYEYFAERGFAHTPTILGVRTTRWSYATYPGIQDKEELYDIQADPQQTRNLAEDPKHAAALAQMRAELERLKKETGYRAEVVPAAPLPAARTNAFVLDYDFSKDTGDQVTDVSGQGNHGKAVGAPLAAGRRGKARKLDGKGHIEVANAPSLNPAGAPWTAEVVFKSEGDSGVLLARGGESQGYALYLKEGRPAFSVTVEKQTTTVMGTQKVAGEWTHVAGVIGEGPSMTLYVNGQPAGTAKLPAFIATDPNDLMQIGTDLRTHVARYGEPFAFTGLVERVRLFSGARTAEQVRGDYQASQ